MIYNNDAYFPLETCTNRFDQKNEMFKRVIWDPGFIELGNKLYYQTRPEPSRYGYRKLDFALRHAGWNIESDFACGTVKSNFGLYSWNQVSEKVQRFAKYGPKVENSKEVNAKIIKKAATFLGADDVGICYAHPSLIYSYEMDEEEKVHKPLELLEGCTNAVVMAVSMDYEASSHSPDAIAAATTGLGYSQMAVVSNYVAAFIRGLGYQAVPSGNDTGLSIPLAIAAGLGEMGRHGILIHPKYGPRLRLCKIFTDMPLKFDDFKPFGVDQFCKTCKKCAKLCPSQAISNDYEPLNRQGPTISNHSGILKWYINPEKCFSFWAKNGADCNSCIMVCPFNKPKGILHNIVRSIIKHMPISNRFMLLMDDLMGYGKFKKINEKFFWED